MDSKQRAWRPETEKKMRADWDHRARENVFYYIASSKDDWDPRRKRMAGSMVCGGEWGVRLNSDPPWPSS